MRTIRNMRCTGTPPPRAAGDRARRRPARSADSPASTPFLASLLGIHIVLAINKMTPDWDQKRFEAIRDEFHEFAARLDVHDVTTIPLSALNGDNVVTKSAVSPWYEGPRR